MASPLTRILNRGLRRLGAMAAAPVVNADECRIGKNVSLGRGVEINCQRLVIGDGAIIGEGTRITMPDLVIGDYTRINPNCLFTGNDWCRIGHNCWFGHFTIVDSIGTTRIGNGVGVGAHSQLWTHAYFGDTLQGCRVASHGPLVIEDDVWLVGHCITGPIHAKARSMAMVGSVVTRGMEENRIYAGSPAKDMSEKLGMQFEEVSLAEKRARMERHLSEFAAATGIRDHAIEIVEQVDPLRAGASQFGLADRLYTKTLRPAEIRFMRWLLPDRAKFLPHPDTDWVRPHLERTP